MRSMHSISSPFGYDGRKGDVELLAVTWRLAFCQRGLETGLPVADGFSALNESKSNPAALSASWGNVNPRATLASQEGASAGRHPIPLRRILKTELQGIRPAWLLP